MGKRYVDADVLEDLARHAGSARQDVQGLFSKCQGRVTAVLRGGWQGTWDDVRNTLGSEMTLLEDHGRELVNRAGRVREAARERVLQELRELWGAIAGLRKEIESTAAWLKGFWEKWERSFRNSVLPDPLPRLQPGPGAAIGALVGIALTWAWKEALQLLDGAGKQEAPAVSTPPKEEPQPAALWLHLGPTPPLQSVAETVAQASRVAATAVFAARYRGQTGVTDPYGGHPGQCVSLVKRFCFEALQIKLDSFAGHTPWGEWDGRHAFTPDKWTRIEATTGGYRVGDIVFFRSINHVGVVVSEPDEHGNFWVLESNRDNNNELSKVERALHNISETKGVMRLKPPA